MKKLSQFFFVMLLLASSTTFAQTADEVIEKYFTAIGGKEKLLALKSAKMTAKIKAQGQEFPVVMLQKAPNLQKMVLVFQGKEITQMAFDGNEGWSTNFMTMKPEKIEAEESENMKLEMDFPDAFLDYKSKGYSILLEGSENIEGTDCHKIKLTKKPVKVDGKEEENFSYYYFDKENNVPIMQKTISKKGQMKGVAIDTFLSDYQEINGLFFAFTISQKVNGQEMANIAVEKMELNVEIPTSEFSFPQN